MNDENYENTTYMYTFGNQHFKIYSLGFPEKGLSVSMINSKLYDYNKWETLRGWDVSIHLAGQYIRGNKFFNHFDEECKQCYN